MPHEFVVLRNGEFETYTNYEDIPDDFDHIIKFIPEIPDSPHTDHDHQTLMEWNEKLELLIAIERNNLKQRLSSIEE